MTYGDGTEKKKTKQKGRQKIRVTITVAKHERLHLKRDFSFLKNGPKFGHFILLFFLHERSGEAWESFVFNDIIRVLVTIKYVFARWWSMWRMVHFFLSLLFSHESESNVFILILRVWASEMEGRETESRLIGWPQKNQKERRHFLKLRKIRYAFLPPHFLLAN